MKSQKQSFKFVCACNCGQLSDELGGKDYIRLLPGEKWYAKGCQPSEGRVFKGGFIVKEDKGDF